MSDANLRQIRVLHIVSAGALASSLQQSLFMPLLTRLPRPRVKSLVACLSAGAVPSAVLRQSGVPTYDLALSRKLFSPRAFQELQQATRNFRPDVIQAWGHTAQIISALLRPRCEWKPQLIWNISDTAPLAKNAGLVDRQKLKYAAKFASRADRIVYSSEAAGAAHRRVGFPEGEHEIIPPGVDATRFKPDFAARRKLREQLNLPGETFVIGMYAPFQSEYDFTTLIRAVGELIKINPNIALVLAGHGVQKGNAPLMALIGGGALSTRVHLLGEWSDISALYNACDLVCSSATNDQSRMNLVMAMLCGVPCVATGMGAQGEVIGQHGVAVEPGNPSAFVKGITRVMQMTPEKRTFMAQGARKHALASYVYVRSLQKYLQLYYDLIGRQALVAQDLPTPDVDPTLTVPPALPTEAEINASKRKAPTVADWGDPDSLESKVTEREPEELPKWRIEQEQERAKREADLAAQVAATKSNGDVLQVFETQNASATQVATPMTERARGVADDTEELLSPDLLTAEVPILPRAANGGSGSKKSAQAAHAASSAPPVDAAKQAALKAARLAALQPIAAPAKRAAAVKPTIEAKAAPAAAPVATSQTIDFNSTQPVLLHESELIQTSPAPAKAEKAETLAKAKQSSVADVGHSATLLRPQLPANVDSSGPHRLKVLSENAVAAATAVPVAPAANATPIEGPAKIAATAASAPSPAPAPEKAADVVAKPAASRPPLELSLAPDVPAPSQKTEPAASPLGRLAKALASASPPPAPPVTTAMSVATAASAEPSRADSKPSVGNIPTAARDTNRTPASSLAIDTSTAVTSSVDVSKASTALTSTIGVAKTKTVPASNFDASKSAARATNDVKPAAPASSFDTSKGAAARATSEVKPAAAATATSSMTAALEKWNSSFDLGELSLMATGMWAAAPRSDATAKRDTKDATADELSGAEALSLISEPTAEETIASTDPTLKLATLADPATEPKRAVNGQ